MEPKIMATRDGFAEKCIEDFERVVLGLKRGDIVPVELGSWEAPFPKPVKEWGVVQVPHLLVRVKTEKVFLSGYGKEWSYRRKLFFYALRHPKSIKLLVSDWRASR